MQRATAAIKAASPTTLVIADLCNCEYTDHGQCGIVNERGEVDNDATVALLVRTALTYARAGVDVVAPSDMMDGRVEAIRSALDAHGYIDVAIMAYSAKYASAYYGPFREAAGSTPQFGDRRGYQMDPPNAREALREIALDIEEGADVVMVKPGLALLGYRARRARRFRRPHRRVQRQRRIRDAQSGDRERMDGRRSRRGRNASVLRARGCRHRHHVFRQRVGAASCLNVTKARSRSSSSRAARRRGFPDKLERELEPGEPLLRRVLPKLARHAARALPLRGARRLAVRRGSIGARSSAVLRDRSPHARPARGAGRGVRGRARALASSRSRETRRTCRRASWPNSPAPARAGDEAVVPLRDGHAGTARRPLRSRRARPCRNVRAGKRRTARCTPPSSG